MWSFVCFYVLLKFKNVVRFIRIFEENSEFVEETV